jgi:hypothetical protein
MKLSLGTACSLVLLLAACAAEQSSDESSDDLTQSTYTFDVKMPAGSSFGATITTKGLACPRGDNLNAALAADGSSLRLELGAYNTTIAKNQTSKSLDCSLQIALKDASGGSVAVTSLTYSGYSTLDKTGMLETHTASYSFAGAPAGPNDRLDVKGPVANAYSFESDVADRDRVWSTCGTATTLNATLGVTLTNNAQKTGTGALDPVAHKVKHAIVFGLGRKACNAPPVDDAGAPPDGRDGGGPTIDPRDGGSLPFPIDFDGGSLPFDFGDAGIVFPPGPQNGGGR